MADLAGALLRAITAGGGQIEAVRTLLGQGADVESKGDSHFTPLYLAAWRGYFEIAELLLDSGASVDALCGQWTPLLEASKEGHLLVVKLLVARGANVNHKANELWTALHMAARNDRLDVCLFLLSQGADLTAVNELGRDALAEYGSNLTLRTLSSETRALRHDALTAAWRAGPHPSQVQRRRDEAWDRRKSLMQVSAENGFRPLLHRQLAEKAAMVEDTSTAIPAIEIDTPAKRHAHLLGQVLSNEGIHRNIVSML